MKYSKFYQEGDFAKSPKGLKSIFKSGKKKEFYPYFKNPLEKKRFTKSIKFHVHKFKKILGVIFFLIAVGFGVFIIRFFVYDSTYFDVKNILVYGAKRFVNPDDLKNLVEGNLQTRNIFYINTAKISRDLNNSFLGAKNISIKKVLPDKLVVNVIERIPMALLYQKIDGELFLIDEDGYVLGTVAPEFMDLPKIQYSDAINIGGFVSQDIVPITREIIKESDQSGLKISSMSYKQKYTKIYLVNSTEAVLNNEKDLKFSLRLLSSLLKRLTLEGKKIEMVDLRYDKVIVK